MMDWIDVMSVGELDANPKRLVRVGGRQILVLRTPTGVAACPNRCPHEGYPLSEGDLSTAGTLRCNWHNWTFDLVAGTTLVGGDKLLQYPVKIENGRILVAPQPPDLDDIQRRARAGIVAALNDADQPRLLRETARLGFAGGDRLDMIRVAVDWLAARSQYGTTHAIAGAPDWLALAHAPDAAPDEQLAALGEILGHIADDGRREARFPYAADACPWDRDAFLAAIEAADEARAIAFIRGALRAGIRGSELLPTLASAALAHYADFGHSIIYSVKTVELLERLGDENAEPLLCLLVRSFCYATREDLVPEFRAYRDTLDRWTNSTPSANGASTSPSSGTRHPIANGARPPLLTDVSVATALDTVVAWSAEYSPEAIFRTLVDSAAFALLHVSEPTLTTTSGSIAKNAGWLDHTHALTFAEAGEHVARVAPELWPAVLLQIACFIGRCHATIDIDLPVDAWQTDTPAAVFARLRASLFDHGRERFIISVHLLKTLTSAIRLVEGGRADPQLMAAALDRFFHAPMKGRHVIRTARQMLAVAAEG